MQQNYPFQPRGAAALSATQNTANIAVTAAAQQIPLPLVPAEGGTMRLVNSGNQVIFWLYGNLAVTTANGVPMLPNTVETFSTPPGTQLSVIAAATGSTLYVTIGDGL